MTDSRITPENAKRLFPGTHMNALKCVSNDPVYVSHGRQEYKIKQDGPYWCVKRWPRGPLAPEIRGTFLSFKDCEARLIRFIRNKDKWGNAMYPGKEPAHGKS